MAIVAGTGSFVPDAVGENGLEMKKVEVPGTQGHLSWR
jgi:hypothetical protein